jgi:hypothetical protein
MASVDVFGCHLLARLPPGVGELPNTSEAEQLGVLLLPGVFGSEQIREFLYPFPSQGASLLSVKCASVSLRAASHPSRASPTAGAAGASSVMGQTLRGDRHFEPQFRRSGSDQGADLFLRGPAGTRRTSDVSDRCWPLATLRREHALGWAKVRVLRGRSQSRD